ncbi:MAG: family 2 glycosyl transferase [Deltaproteobacteria bacterium HGW-Deltaproteobacteria-8]|jgi:GT2 family glycosyltransferase|nr:MAG: family 2 glycosyl transferase [Deltaproteobacteria bacterium HGW-Deltaproteobacteria-8]
MNTEFFRILRNGLAGELACLTVGEAMEHFRNHQASFHLDRAVVVCYLNHFLAEHEKCADPGLWQLIERLITKCLHLSPFDVINISTPSVLGNPAFQAKIRTLHENNFAPAELARIDQIDFLRDSARAREALLGLLATHPTYALAAGRLLVADFLERKASPDWLHAFTCPEPLKGDFGGMLFNHYAAMGNVEAAEALWESLSPADINEVHLNHAAELARMRGDAKGAVAFYEKSLALDGDQAPVRFRLAELQRPSVKRPELVAQKKVAIYLYSFNKAKLLGETLTCLAATDIGRASVTVLLNGCSDDSLAVVESARELFPDNAFTILPLPVNIGAPAARNWLTNLPSTWENDYVAFLDDDVEMPRDWLQWYLSIAEADPRIGVVGCKIVYPGQPAKLQYLYRYVSIAKNDLLRLSLSVAHHQYDNGFYDCIRETRSVMGCLHLFRTEALRRVPNFDIRFSPSQMDDIDHDLCLCLEGFKVMYCGLVACIHHQSSGLAARTEVRNPAMVGNCLGNDVKVFYKHLSRMSELRCLDNLSLLPADFT